MYRNTYTANNDGFGYWFWWNLKLHRRGDACGWMMTVEPTHLKKYQSNWIISPGRDDFFFRNHYLALENPRSLASFPFPPACYVGPSLGKMVGTIFPDDKTSNQHILCGVAGFFSNKNPFSKSPVRLLWFCSFFFSWWRHWCARIHR